VNGRLTTRAMSRPSLAQAMRDWTTVQPYALPFVLFGVMTVLDHRVPPSLYPLTYTLKVIAVTAALLVFRRPLGDISPARRVVAPSVLVGFGVFVMWVGLDHLVPYPPLGSRVAFNPFALGMEHDAWLFLLVRLYGLVVVVPVMEELFWRSFLLRYLTSRAFRRLPMGTFSTSALLTTMAASGVSHPEWLVAAVATLAYALWLRRTRSLYAVVVAHASTNAALGAYVLATGSWVYW